MEVVSDNSALSNTRVLEFAVGSNAAYAGAILAQFGAEVIKIEAPGPITERLSPGLNEKLAPGRTSVYEHTNANKSGVSLNLKNSRGQLALQKLVEASDVLITGQRSETLKTLGLDYASVSKWNPNIIYASSNAYGTEGPDSDQGGFDPTAMARSGLMFGIGEPGMPPLLSNAGWVATMGGTLLAIGILCALEARDQLTIGQRVETSLLGACIHLARFDIYTAISIGTPYERLERARAHNPLWNYYLCQDGEWIILAMPWPDPVYWPLVCHTLGLESLITDPRCGDAQSRYQHREPLVAAFDGAFLTKPRIEWIAIFKKAGVVSAPVNHIADLATDQQVMVNGYLMEYEHPNLGRQLVPGPPVKLSETPASNPSPAPLPGQDSEAVLTKLCGYTKSDVEELRRLGVV